MLACVGFGEPRNDTTWTYNGQILANSSLVTIYRETDMVQGRSFVLSILQLCSLSRASSGVYTCTINNGQRKASASTTLNVIGNYGDMTKENN